MWWKLSALMVVTAALVFAAIPIRTHAVKYDPLDPPSRPTFTHMVANMYLTPGSGLLIVLILAIAVIVALGVIRG